MKNSYKIWKEAEEKKQIYCDISHRGGGIGIYREWLANRISCKDCDSYYIETRLPRYFGAGCNYLGGGLRGSIFPSDFDKDIYEECPKIAKLLNEISLLAVKKYKETEKELDLEEWDEWGYRGTEQIRKQGIKSAY